MRNIYGQTASSQEAHNVDADPSIAAARQAYQAELARVSKIKHASIPSVRGPGAKPDTVQYQAAVEQARALAAQQIAGLQQAQGMRGEVAQGYADREGRLTQYLQGRQQEEQAKIQQQSQEQLARTQQDLSRRGLANPGAMQSATGGSQSDMASALAQSQERQLRESIDYRRALGGETLQARGAEMGGALDTARQAFGMGQLGVGLGMSGAGSYSDAMDAYLNAQLGYEQLRKSSTHQQAVLRSESEQFARQQALARLGIREGSAITLGQMSQAESEAKAQASAKLAAAMPVWRIGGPKGNTPQGLGESTDFGMGGINWAAAGLSPSGLPSNAITERK